MKKHIISNKSLLTLSMIVFTSSAQAMTVLIGDGIRNGFFSDTSNPTSATGDTIMTNASGRALIASATTNDSLEIANWTITRQFYNGGNNAFGFDAAAGRTTGSVPYAFTNAGNALLTADAVAGSYSIGDIFTLNFGGYTDTARTDHEVLATLMFDSGESFSSTLQLGDNQGDTALFDENFTLTQAATSVTLTLLLQSDLTDSNGNGRRNGQFTVDDVQLSVVPEPSSTLLSLAGIGILGFRRRR